MLLSLLLAATVQSQVSIPLIENKDFDPIASAGHFSSKWLNIFGRHRHHADPLKLPMDNMMDAMYFGILLFIEIQVKLVWVLHLRNLKFCLTLDHPISGFRQ